MRLIVVVEGQTEEAFVKDVLVPHLAPQNVFASATVVGKIVSQRRGHRRRGGGYFLTWLRDLRRLLGGDTSSNLRVTTLFDLYGLPRDFPGIDAHGKDADTNHRCDQLQTSLATELNDHRFIPYIQRHEFEALVIASLPSLRLLLDDEDDLAGVQQLEKELSSHPPEDINDGEDTAPSKRLCERIPGYNKVLHGPLAIAGTGLSAIRQRCPRFNTWVSQLEALGSETTL